jgi:hypothetical protein
MIYFYDLNEILNELLQNISMLTPENYHLLHKDQYEMVNGIDSVDYGTLFILGVCTSLLTLTCCVSNKYPTTPKYVVVNGEPINGELVNV